MITRRSFLQATAGAAAMGFSSGRVFSAESAGAIKLPEVGRLKPLPSKAIQASPLSIGFETLDRYQFDPTRTYEHLGKLGVKWARAQTGWCRCETEKGKYDFRWLDEIAESLLAQGIEPWFSLSYGNRLYTPEAPDVSAVGFSPMFTEDARNGWAAYVDAITQHFAGRVKKWEIWNEPNGKTFWRPRQPDAAGYVELARFTSPIVRRRIPDATVVGLGLAGCSMKYMEEALKAGLAECVDRISFHPYGSMPENAESFVAKVRELLGDRSKTVKPVARGMRLPLRPQDRRGHRQEGSENERADPVQVAHTAHPHRSATGPGSDLLFHHRRSDSLQLGQRALEPRPVVRRAARHRLHAQALLLRLPVALFAVRRPDQTRSASWKRQPASPTRRIAWPASLATTGRCTPTGRPATCWATSRQEP